MFEINSEPHEMLANILPRGTPYKKNNFFSQSVGSVFRMVLRAIVVC